MSPSIVKKLYLLLHVQNHSDLKTKILSLRQLVSSRKKDSTTAHILSELDQILKAQTLVRTRYYIRRLIKGLTEIKTGKLNDLNLNRWKEYDDLITDSLWFLDKRDRSGTHSADYWGNFVPQIPNQLLRRFTKKGEWVLDPFLGSGTTLIECKQLGRNGIGIELQSKIAQKANNSLKYEKNPNEIRCEIITGDSTQIDFSKQLEKLKVKSVQFALVHPPYWDIIKFSKKNNDLSNARSLEEFVGSFGIVIRNCASILDKRRYLAVVIGDKYKEPGRTLALPCTGRRILCFQT
jgi:hypothetical protein